MTTMTPPATVTNEEKQTLWQDYEKGVPKRVPINLTYNPRIILSDPTLNPEGITFEQYFKDARTHLDVVLRFHSHLRHTIQRYTDAPTGTPDVWVVNQMIFNVYEAAQFGAPVEFPAGQVPCTEPILNTPEDFDRLFAVDIANPLKPGGWLDERLQFNAELERLAAATEFEGRPVKVAPFAPLGTDGPFTVACNLRGTEFLMDMIAEPELADRLLGFITDAAIHRRRALLGHYGDRIPSQGLWLADDSVAMLSIDMCRERVMPHLQRVYAEAGGSRFIHLCGDATRHFPTLHEELNVKSFDTGFPVNFGKLRAELGDEVEIFGGPEVDLLMRGTPAKVYERTVNILKSGIMRGRRFVLREGNNLPPCTPLENLAAMYQATLDHGWHES
jgi:hypothetical protein